MQFATELRRPYCKCGYVDSSEYLIWCVPSLCKVVCLFKKVHELDSNLTFIQRVAFSRSIPCSRRCQFCNSGISRYHGIACAPVKPLSPNHVSYNEALLAKDEMIGPVKCCTWTFQDVDFTIFALACVHSHYCYETRPARKAF